MGLRTLGKSRVEKLRNSMAISSRSRMKMWLIRATTSVLLWTCIVQLTALGDMWGPRVLKGWPSCFTHESAARALDIELPSARPRILPPKSEFSMSIKIFTLEPILSECTLVNWSLFHLFVLIHMVSLIILLLFLVFKIFVVQLSFAVGMNGTQKQFYCYFNH